MTSRSPTRPWPLLLLTIALSISGCATPAPNSPPPVIGAKPKATPLPAEISLINTEPSSGYFAKLDSYLSSLETWRLKVEAYLQSATAK